MDIPRLRELAAFEVAAEAHGPKSWRTGHGWFLVGVVVAICAASGAGLFSSFDGGAARRLPDERLIRAHVDSADAATVHKAWLLAKRSGIDRGAGPEEVLVKQSYDSSRRVALFLWCVAAAGFLAAVGGGIASVVPASEQRGQKP